MSRSGLPDRVTSTVISVVHQGSITIPVRLAVRCSLVALLGATTFAMARDGAGHPGSGPATPGVVVRQAHVDPRTITVPVVDAKGIRFTRLSTDEGLSQDRKSVVRERV